MMISQTLREHAGLNWVLDKLNPLSAFGRALPLTWYDAGQEAALEIELSNVAQALPLWETQTPTFRALTRGLTQFHNIRNSFDRNAGNPFDLVELFEVKHFLLTLEQVLTAYRSLSPFETVVFHPMDTTLDLLDPSGQRLPTFAIDHGYHGDLAPLRQKKKALETAIGTAQGQEKADLLEQRRILAVQEDGLELEVRQQLTAQLMAQKEDFLHNMDTIAHLDLILSKALLARRHHCVRPTISREKELSFRGLIHPQVAEDVRRRGDEFSPIDVDLTQGCAVITGANMGGKTVSIRGITLNILLAQWGFFLFAETATVPLFHHVELILADNGAGNGGLSSFGTEVVALDNLLKTHSQHFFFVALDEFARGTNPQEGAALAKALVGHLSTLPCIGIMTTHYDGVSAQATTHYQVSGLTRTVDDDPMDDPKRRIARRMDYSLKPVPPLASCPRDALSVCRLLNLDQNLLEIFQKVVDNS